MVFPPFWQRSWTVTPEPKLKYWGEKNCMWSSDYPHANMTWSNSWAFLAKQSTLPARM